MVCVCVSAIGYGWPILAGKVGGGGQWSVGGGGETKEPGDKLRAREATAAGSAGGKSCTLHYDDCFCCNELCCLLSITAFTPQVTPLSLDHTVCVKFLKHFFHFDSSSAQWW